MNLLGAALYDPTTAATKATTALIAMTALDTTNLRLTVTVPAHGFVRVKMRCNVFGATTFPQILLGVMVASAVAGRVAPQITIDGTALATTFAVADADFVITGLTPGSTVFDAAYAVQVAVASSNIKYGGPDDNSGADAWGAFSFQIWDPQPIPTAAPGAANGLFIAGTNAATTVTTALTANVIGNVTGNLSGSVGSVTGAVGSVTGAVGSVTGNVGGSVASVTGLTTATITTAVLTTQMTESYAALHAAPTLAQAVFEQRAILAENSVSSTTVTTKKIDGSTTAGTYTINSATTPTAITRAS